MYKILIADFTFEDKKAVRLFFNELRQAFLDWNGTPQSDKLYVERKASIEKLILSKVRG